MLKAPAAHEKAPAIAREPRMFQVKVLVHHNVFAIAERYEIAANTRGVHERMTFRAVPCNDCIFARDPRAAPGTVIGFFALMVVLL